LRSSSDVVGWRQNPIPYECILVRKNQVFILDFGFHPCFVKELAVVPGVAWDFKYNKDINQI
jgi:hypothetical protein